MLKIFFYTFTFNVRIFPKLFFFWVHWSHCLSLRFCVLKRALGKQIAENTPRTASHPFPYPTPPRHNFPGSIRPCCWLCFSGAQCEKLNESDRRRQRGGMWVFGFGLGLGLGCGRYGRAQARPGKIGWLRGICGHGVVSLWVGALTADYRY